jgi:hypothetical protein
MKPETRITKDNLATSIHSLSNKVSETKAPQKEGENRFYTFFGKHQFVDEFGYPRLIDDEKEELIYAKELIVGSSTKYYVREEGGKPYNPNPIIPKARSDKDRLNPIRFMGVSQNVFKMYIQYLKTKNQAHLTNATREI